MTVHQLAKHIQGKAMGPKRFSVAIAGPPASGKSTLAKSLCEILQGLSVPTKVVPMDGFHLDNRLLDEMSLTSRKGSPPTFDSAGFCHLIQRLSECSGDIFIPTFDRDRDISLACSDKVSTNDTVLLVEGNYLFLKQEPWNELAEYWDETVFLKPDLATIKARLIDRWLNHGLSKSEAIKRAHKNDLPNAQVVLEQSYSANFEIIDEE